MRYHNMRVRRPPAGGHGQHAGRLIIAGHRRGLALTGLESAADQLVLLNKDVEACPGRCTESGG